MGNLCKAPNYLINDIDLSQKDISIKKYSAVSDSYYIHFDKKYNYLKYIDLSEFIFHATKQYKDSDAFIIEISESDLDLFINQYVLNNHSIENNESEVVEQAVFKNFILSVHKWLSNAYLQYLKYKKIEIVKTGNIKLIGLIAIGLLFSHADVSQKIDVIFNILAVENRIFKYDNTLLFFFYLFIIPTYISLGCFYSIYAINNEINLSEMKYNELMAKFSPKSIFNLTEIFLKTFFDDDDKGFTYQDFKKRIVVDDYSWVLTQSGIRFYLEKYNFS
jgi:hypothetical protein